MARTHARWKVEAWQPGSDFRALNLEAQWLYIALVSQPQINNIGLLYWAPQRLAQLSPSASVRALNRALRELNEHKYVAFDARTSELVVRSFVRNDQVWKQPNLVKSARKQFKEVESSLLRQIVAHEYPWIANETAEPSGDKPEGVLKGVWEDLWERSFERGQRARAPREPSPTPAPTPSPSTTTEPAPVPVPKEPARDPDDDIDFDTPTTRQTNGAGAGDLERLDPQALLERARPT